MQLCKDGGHSLASQSSFVTISMSSGLYQLIEAMSRDTRDWGCWKGRSCPWNAPWPLLLITKSR